jgi:hypothetical protein
MCSLAGPRMPASSLSAITPQVENRSNRLQYESSQENYVKNPDSRQRVQYWKNTYRFADLCDHVLLRHPEV